MTTAELIIFGLIILAIFLYHTWRFKERQKIEVIIARRKAEGAQMVADAHREFDQIERNYHSEMSAIRWKFVMAEFQHNCDWVRQSKQAEETMDIHDNLNCI